MTSQERAFHDFAQFAAAMKGDEKSEAQLFLIRLLEAFGHEGQGIAPHCHAFHAAIVKEPVQWARMIVRLPVTTPSSMGYFYSAELAAKVRELLATQAFACGAVLSDNLVSMLFFWEGLLIFLYAFIALSKPDQASKKTAMKAFLINAVTDLCLLAGVTITGYIAAVDVTQQFHTR